MYLLVSVCIINICTNIIYTHIHTASKGIMVLTNFSCTLSGSTSDDSQTPTWEASKPKPLNPKPYNFGDATISQVREISPPVRVEGRRV